MDTEAGSLCPGIANMQTKRAMAPSAMVGPFLMPREHEHILTPPRTHLPEPDTGCSDPILRRPHGPSRLHVAISWAAATVLAPATMSDGDSSPAIPQEAAAVHSKRRLRSFTEKVRAGLRLLRISRERRARRWQSDQRSQTQHAS